MEQKVMGHTVPAEAAYRDAVMDMGQDESVLILIKHCRDMKQQETRLRLVTLLVLLSCMALFIVTTRVHSRQHENSGSRQQGSADEQHPAYSKQEKVCSEATDNHHTNVQRLHIHLRSVPAVNKSDGLYMKWDAMFGDQYNQEKRAIVIPETGFYFVYVRITLSCHDDEEDFKRFSVELHNWTEGYNKTVLLMEARDGVACSSAGPRTVFVGQLFDLFKGDLVSVWIKEGYKLIRKSSFGAYLT